MSDVVLPVLGEALPFLAFLAVVALAAGPCDRLLAWLFDVDRRWMR